MISKTSFANHEKDYASILENCFNNLDPNKCRKDEVLYFEIKEKNLFVDKEVNKNINVDFYTKYWVNASHLYLTNPYADYIATPKKVFLITMQDSAINIFDNSLANKSNEPIPMLNKYSKLLPTAKITEAKDGFIIVEYAIANTDTLNYEGKFTETHTLTFNTKSLELVQIKIATNDPNAEIYEKSIYIQNRKIISLKELTDFQKTIFEKSVSELIKYFQINNFKFSNNAKLN